jgi:hypothetical protein
MSVLADIASDTTLDAAFVWLCKRRRDHPAHADVWGFRLAWPQEQGLIRSELLAGELRFSLLDGITKADGEDIDLWSARDALVLKALAGLLAKVLPNSSRCTHVQGHGGAQGGRRLDSA